MRRLWWIVLVVLVVVGAFGPVLATDLPVAARVDGALQFPAFAAWVGDAPEAPDGEGWHAWAASLDEDGDDWVFLAPVPFDPMDARGTRILVGPSGLHPFGTDDTGRDVLACIVHGTSTALLTALSVVICAGFVGIALGAWAGLHGGWVDACVLRLIELFQCFPALVVVMCIATFVDGSGLAIVAVLASVYWTSFARIVRGEFLSLREREWVLAARGLGVGTTRLLLRHMLPAIRGPIGLATAFVAASAIVVESTLRFLGLGGTGDVVSWGELIAQFRVAGASAWHVWLFPSLAVAVTVLALHGLVDRAKGSAESETA